MNVAQLINILREMDGEADIALFVDRLNGDEWESVLVVMNADDLVIANSYVAFQVPSERFDDDN